MWKFTVLICYFIFSTASFSQSSKLAELEGKKKLIEQKIKILQDSLDFCNVELNKLKFNKSNITSTESGEIYVCKGLTKLMESPKFTSNIIDNFEKNARLIVVGHYGDYMKVEIGNKTGFVHRIFLEKEVLNTNGPDLSTSIKSVSPSTNYNSTTRKTYNSRTYYRGPRGGCYYINSNGNKSYVDRSMCN
ncbi:hypothetical protein SAMN03080602_04324 [Arenibacter troitsensis]|uniref:SH3 domain-containing protein n=1 Tax=Arenibacter troitsensis TaxID=188872 RepID=A0A1X7LGR2_9FLAO|nr:hypothetical protein SAMN03080602_04324 [Arenibacter troitsensis]